MTKELISNIADAAHDWWDSLAAFSALDTAFYKGDWDDIAAEHAWDTARVAWNKLNIAVDEYNEHMRVEV